MPSLYLFVSTASSAGINEGTWRAIQENFSTSALSLNVGNSGQYWSNGFALRFYSTEPLKDWREWLNDELKGIAEFWLLHDGEGNSIDNMGDGPGAMALQKLGSRSVCQLFLRYDKSDTRQQDRVEKLMKDFGEHGVHCKHAFGFNNGEVRFLTSLQVGRTIFRRCESAFRQSIDYTLIDALGVCYGCDGEIDDEDAWTTLQPPQKPLQLFGNRS